MKLLTKAEEQIMQILWELKRGYVRDILEKLPVPKPAYNTVSTIVRILEKKGFVGYLPYGKAHEYYPLITKTVYRKNYFKGFVQNYFGNSYQALTSFFTGDQDLSLNELEELRQLLDEEIKKKKKE